ncbi:VP3 [Gyrovirus Tu789]|uniref:Apoptin n=1 Tax=Gyrovirus Tu789 TaxID=1415628 RepID=U5UAJ3_9VIRU|nr:VP3 [Gyrovirus Tu789]AGZ20420.1 VP3 [Gyrovirus Tu789]QCT05725.1 VP3 [Gyrovirus 6]QCT05728.1 VP3 [Gyrovirus 6]
MSENTSTGSSRATNSSPSVGTHCKEILIGLGSVTIALSLPGCATVRVLTTRSATADSGEDTGSRSALDLRTPAARQRTLEPRRICADCASLVPLQKENLITSTVVKRGLRL